MHFICEKYLTCMRFPATDGDVGGEEPGRKGGVLKAIRWFSAFFHLTVLI